MVVVVWKETPFTLFLSFVFFFMGEQDSVRVLRAGDLVLSLFLLSSSGVMVEVLGLLGKMSEIACCLRVECFSFDTEDRFVVGDLPVNLVEFLGVGGFKMEVVAARGGKLRLLKAGAGAGVGAELGKVFIAEIVFDRLRACWG